MAGISFKDNNNLPVFLDFADGYGEAKVGKIKYRWEFDSWCGPLFLNKDGSERKIFPSAKNKVWKFFYKWLNKFEKDKLK